MLMKVLFPNISAKIFSQYFISGKFTTVAVGYLGPIDTADMVGGAGFL